MTKLKTKPEQKITIEIKLNLHSNFITKNQDHTNFYGPVDSVIGCNLQHKHKLFILRFADKSESRKNIKSKTKNNNKKQFEGKIGPFSCETV